jgi:hypothetical protein
MKYKAPAAAREAARRALEVRAEKPPSERGMMATGLARARQLINNDDFTESDIRTMYAWFRRHAVDKQGSTWGDQGKGWQAWHGWGGDSAFSWVSRIVRQLDAQKAVQVKPYFRDGEIVQGYSRTGRRRNEPTPATRGPDVVPEQVQFPALYRRARRMARQKYDTWPNASATAYMISAYEKLVKARGGKPYRTTKSLESAVRGVILYSQDATKSDKLAHLADDNQWFIQQWIQLSDNVSVPAGCEDANVE